MATSVGDKLGPYEIVAPLGEGGMGQVWKARDTRLNRMVAIKTSRKQFNERFEREAQAIAALNHPNVCSLYDVGPDYLVMEYVEGKPVKGPVPLDTALAMAGQILEALEAAHHKGITHRDLKPGNIMVGKTGVKVLDFGLAKFKSEPGTQSGPEGATMTMPLTNEGAILGTLQYMAPEQLEGKEADARSDIFAFGLVLHELITGRRAFTGASQASLIAAILKEPAPSLGALQPVTPPSLDRILQTCLEKDPDKRWQSAREIKHALEWMTQTPAAAVAAPVASPTKSLGVWKAAAAVLAVAVAAIAGWTFWPKTEPAAQMTRFQVPIPENVAFSQYVSVSPDGRKLAFNATGQQGGLWIRDLDALEWRHLQGTEGAVSPFWSPDSKYLGFGAGLQLKKIDIAGGPAQTLCEVQSAGVGTGAWNKEGIIIFGGRGSGPIFKVSQAGGVATAITAVDTSKGEAFHALPSFMPDGRHFVFLRNGTPEVMGIYSGSLDAKPEEQSRERIMANPLAASFVNGYLFFMRDGTLMTQPFDPGQMKLNGEPVPVAEHVGVTQSIGVFSVSPSGTLAYRSGANSQSLLVTFLDRQGKNKGTFGKANADQEIRLSPDTTKAVVRGAARAGLGDIWILDFDRGVRTRFTFRQGAGSSGIWSPDGSRIAFAAGTLMDTIYEKSSTGAGEEKELLKEAGRIHIPTNWSRDGKFLFYHTLATPKTGTDLWVLPLEGDRKPAQLLATEFNEVWGAISPDSRWFAYHSGESGRMEVYVRPFLATGPSGGPALGEGKWQISRDGGDFPAWTGDGREIIFQGPPNGRTKLAVEVNGSGAGLVVGVPKTLFLGSEDFGWDVSLDGKRFVMTSPETQERDQAPITVVLNWQSQLQK